MTRRIIAVTVAIVLAAIGTGAVLLYLRTADARALEGKEARTVLIADKVIPAGTGAKVLRGGEVRTRGPDARGDPARGCAQ